MCPDVSERAYVDGVNMIQRKIRKFRRENKEYSDAYADTLLSVYDMRIQYFGKEGYVLGRKGTAMLRWQSNDIEAAFNTLKTSIELQDENSEAAVLGSYMIATVKMEKKGFLSKQDVIAIYEQLMQTVEVNLEKQTGKKLGYFQDVKDRIQSTAEEYLN